MHVYLVRDPIGNLRTCHRRGIGAFHLVEGKVNICMVALGAIPSIDDILILDTIKRLSEYLGTLVAKYGPHPTSSHCIGVLFTERCDS